MNELEPLNHLLSKLFELFDFELFDETWQLPDILSEGEIWWTRPKDGKRVRYVYVNDDLTIELSNILTNLNLPLEKFIPIGMNLEGTLKMEVMASSNCYRDYYLDPSSSKVDYIFKVERLNNYEKLIRVGENFK